ncbi:chromate resistance protein [Leptolyngbya subtilissima ST-M1]|uniref:chromate resistance protein ChrB domain-containing protein n=1 Tax=Cyanophyceae TaxID=3028117 RepID=UPI0018F03FCD|nr:chromate resistance protein ChrB domain-containing protein [Nodosilinea sp. FACHB-131]
MPSKASSSPRVTLWRRLKRLGAIAFNSVQVLPERDECLEAFQWLAQEVQKASGEALIMRVEQFEGLSDSEIVERFRAARRDDYAELEAQATALANSLDLEARGDLQERLEKLYRHYADIRRIDFFDCPEGAQVMAYLNQMVEALTPAPGAIAIAPAALDQYQQRSWVTRPRPHVDRLACIWLIRRFIDPNAVIRYAKTAAADEVTFDMSQGDFQHQGNLCTFEVMVRAFGLDDNPALQVLGQIVHEIDLRDGQYRQPQTAGVDALLRGWLLANFSDAALEMHGIALFEGLYATLAQERATPLDSSAPQAAEQ